MGNANASDAAGPPGRTVLLLLPGILVSPRAFDATLRHLRSEVEVRIADTASRDAIEATAADA